MKKFVGGMNKDTSKADQPNGTYRDALNAVVSLETGTVNNEYGTNSATGANIDVCGAIPITEERVIFLGLDLDGVSTIAMSNPSKGESTVLYKDSNLNFKLSHPIAGEYRQDAKNDIIIYFTDNYFEFDEDINEATYVSNYNPPRTFNVTRQLQAFANLGVDTSRLYGESNYNVDKLTLFPDVGAHSRIKNAYVREGGAVVAATYHLALAYADEDFVETNYFVVSNPLYVVPEPDNTLPADIVIGAQKGTVTTKSLHWELYVPRNVNYKYVQPAVIQRIGDAENVYRMNRVEIQFSGNEDLGQLSNVDGQDISGSPSIPTQSFDVPSVLVDEDVSSGRTPVIERNQENQDTYRDLRTEAARTPAAQTRFVNIVFTGREDVSTLSTLDIVADRIKYLTAKTLTQLNDQLYLGNLISRKDIGFQRYCTNIRVKPVVKAVEGFDRRSFDIITLNKGYGTMTMPYWHAVNHPRGFDGVGQSYYQSVGGTDGAPLTNLPAGSPTANHMYPDYISAIADYLRYDSTGSNILRIGSAKTGVQYSLADATRRGYKDNRFTYRGKTFKRGDVYAFYISFVLKDGTETYAYHIPGRPPLPLFWSSTHKDVMGLEGYTEDQRWQFLLKKDLGNWYTGTSYLMENDKFTTMSGMQWYSHGYYPNEIVDQNKDARIHQYLDTSYTVNSSNVEIPNFDDYRYNMGFWENENEYYPTSPDFRFTDVNATNGSALDQILVPSGPGEYDHLFYTLQRRRVRHHKMPSNYSRDFSYIQYSSASVAGSEPSTGTANNAVGSLSFDRNYGALFFENTANLEKRGFMAGYEGPEGPNTIDGFDPKTLVGAPWIASHRDSTTSGYGYTKKRLISNETARILGVQFENIKIPRHILKEVQGYKIYYAKRTNSDKIVAGQSLAIPCMPRFASSPNQNRLLARKGPYFNAFYAYGGLRNDMETAMAVAADWRGSYHTDNEPNPEDPTILRAPEVLGNTTPVDTMFRYYGNPVFTFHDFGMLRKRPSLNTVTHVQCQAAIGFRHYQGGPGVFGNRKEDQELKDSGSSYTLLTTFPSLGWISQGLGNIVDYNVDGEIYDVTDTFIDADEDVNNPYGNDNPPANDEDKPGGFFKRSFRRLRGKEKDIDDVEDYSDVSELRARRYRIRQYRGGAYIACAHYYPEDIYKHPEIIVGGDHRKDSENDWANTGYTDGYGFDFSNTHARPANNQFLFATDPGSKTYLPGLKNLRTPESSSFKGAQYIFNRGGETSIVMGLVSGLPHLKGIVPFRANAGEYEPFYTGAADGGITGPYNIAAWGDEDKFLFPDAFVSGTDPKRDFPIPDYFAQNPAVSDDLNGPGSQYKGLNYTLSGADSKFGFPMAWLINVCAAKTDVYNPFDKQPLVWTGFYHSITEEFEDFEQAAGLDEGTIAAELLKETPTTAYPHVLFDIDVAAPYMKYFEGASSDEVFGGDTYISRYSFRTTSHSYGHSWFRASVDLGDAGPDGQNSNEEYEVIAHPGAVGNSKNTSQKDVPDFLSLNDFGTAWGTTSGMLVWKGTNNASDIGTNIDLTDGLNGNESQKIEDFVANTLMNAQNWQQGKSDPMTAMFSFMIESDDNIGLRHARDTEKGVGTKFFDFNTAAEVLFSPPTQDFTKQDNLLYEDHLSYLQDKKVTVPFPKERAGIEENDSFATRIIRSKTATGSLSDRYREFLANDYADIPKNRGEVTNLFTIGDTLYIHAEKAIFQTKGNEQLELGSVKAFIGSGDIFAIAPTELQNSEIGYGGTTSFLSSLTTQFGHFYVARRNRKVHMLTQGIEEVMTGMEHWFRDNIPFAIESYGINVDAEDFAYNPDSPLDINNPMGFHVGYDAKFKRIVLTKRDLKPTQALIDGIADGSIEVKNNSFVTTEDTGTRSAAARIEKLNSLVENTTKHSPLGPGDRAREVANNPDDGSNKGKVTDDIIGLGNETYFERVGWTLSYLPELKMWISRHSYTPNLYINGEYDLYSVEGKGFFKHDNESKPGDFYNVKYNFELEYIDNAEPGSNKLYSNVYYWADAKKRDDVNVTEFKRQTFPIFDRFYVYNVDQISGEYTDISYLNNCRLVDKIWYINSFRDLSSTVTNTNSYINTGKPNVVGNLTTSIQSTKEDTPMFTEEGIPNPDYITADKQWFLQKKFSGHYLGVRLISNNQSENLIHLYAAGTKYRRSFR